MTGLKKQLGRPPRGAPAVAFVPSLEDEVACARIELHRRYAVYPLRVEKGLMGKIKAGREVATMEAIVYRLQTLVKTQPRAKGESGKWAGNSSSAPMAYMIGKRPIAGASS